MKIINSIVNLFWTILGFLPVIYLWYTQWDPFMLMIDVVISLLVLMLPMRFFKIGLSRKNFEKIGIHLVGYIVQDGKLIKTLTSERGLKNNFVHATRRERFKHNSVMNERFHLVCCFFFLISMVIALIAQRFMLSGFLFISNILYNILPVLLQQYYRLRVQGIQKLAPCNQVG